MDRLPPGMMRTITLDFPAAMEHIRVTTGKDHASFAFFLRARCYAISKNELLQNFGTHTSLAWLHLYLLDTFWHAMLSEAGKNSPSPWAQPAKAARWDLKNGPNDVVVDSEWVLETGRCYIGDGDLVDFLAEGARPALPGTAASSLSLYVGPHLKARKRFLLPRVPSGADDDDDDDTDDENARRPVSPTPASRTLADAKVPPAAPDPQAGKKRWRLSTRDLPPPPKFELPGVAPEKKRKATFEVYYDSSSDETVAATSPTPAPPRKRARITVPGRGQQDHLPQENQTWTAIQQPDQENQTWTAMWQPDQEGSTGTALQQTGQENPFGMASQQPGQENSTGTTSQQPHQLRQQPERQWCREDGRWNIP